MGDAFGWLREKREAEEAEAARQVETERLTKEAEERRGQARIKISDQYNEMVRGVLEPLREAAYPDHRVHRSSGYYLRSEYAEYTYTSWRWCIEYKTVTSGDVQEGRYGCSVNWTASVVVRLVFDEHDQASGFEVTVPGRGYYKRKLFGNTWVRDSTRHCSLGEQALTETLNALHKLQKR